MITSLYDLDTSEVSNYIEKVFADSTSLFTGAFFMALTKPDFRFCTSGRITAAVMSKRYA